MRSCRNISSLVLVLSGCAPQTELYDLVIRDGRVIDPETGLDAVRDVAITDGRIVRVSESPLASNNVIDASGLIVAPGFIDLHQHQQDRESYRLKALDGVTTVLELETGVPNIQAFVEEREGVTPIHFGAAASHEAARVQAWGLPLPASTFGPAAGIPDPASGPVTDSAATDVQMRAMLELLEAELDAGALGVGVGLEYTPGATRLEVIELFRLAAEYGRPVFIHVRSAGATEPGSSAQSVLEVVAAAAATGASGHIVHINSSCLRQTMVCLSLIEGARARGLDITTEAYPYGAGMTYISSAFFNDGWRERRTIDYPDVELPESGERLTADRFAALRASPDPHLVLVHMNPDSLVNEILQHPLVMVASDGIDGHPRNAGTFSRVLARLGRSGDTTTWLEVIRKLSLMPAQRLELATLDARRKGRLQEGADADIVVFDPSTIQDRSTFSAPAERSQGVVHVIVAGEVVVQDGQLVEGPAPGRPLVADARQ